MTTSPAAQHQSQEDYLTFFDSVIEYPDDADDDHIIPSSTDVEMEDAPPSRPQPSPPCKSTTKNRASAKTSHYQRNRSECFVWALPPSNTPAHERPGRFPGSSLWSSSDTLTPEQQRSYNAEAYKNRGTRSKGGHNNHISCLRCRLLKQRCSDTSPCAVCRHIVDATSRAVSLTWMLCVEPSFDDVNIFYAEHLIGEAQSKAYTSRLGCSPFQVQLDVPFDPSLHNFRNAVLPLIGKTLEHNKNPVILNQDGIPCAYSSDLGYLNVEGTLIFGNIQLDARRGMTLELEATIFRALSIYLFDDPGLSGRQARTVSDPCSLRARCGYSLISKLDRHVQKKRLAASQLSDLNCLVFTIFMLMVGLKIRTADETDLVDSTAEASKREALERLLCHYMFYIGERIGLLRPTDDVRAMLTEGSFLSGSSLDSALDVLEQSHDIGSYRKCTVCNTMFILDVTAVQAMNIISHCFHCRKSFSDSKPTSRAEEIDFLLAGVGGQFDNDLSNFNSMLIKPPPLLLDDVPEFHHLSHTQDSWLDTFLLRGQLSREDDWTNGTPYWVLDTYGNASLSGSDTYVPTISFDRTLLGDTIMID